MKIFRNRTFFVCMTFIAFVGAWSCSDDDSSGGVAPTAAITSIEPASADYGDTVTITGTNFNDAILGNTVKFNGIEAKILSATVTQLTAEVPVGGSTEGGVLVETYASAAASNTVDITVTSALIVSLSTTDGDPGKSITITGANFSTTPSENQVEFNGSDGTVTASTATSLTVTVPVFSTGDLTVTVNGITSNALEVKYVGPELTFISFPLADSDDDAEESLLDGNVTTTSSDLELGEFDTFEREDGKPAGLQIVGILFRDVTLPDGAILGSVAIQFQVDDDGKSPCQMTIYGEDVGNAALYEGAPAFNMSSRTKTSKSVVWDVPEWPEVGDRGDDQKTPELKKLLLEIMGRSDYANGNNVNFIMEPTGPSADATENDQGRETESGKGDDSPTLVIGYVQG
ncbi:MAG: IPT/TIG domain-containing protein [Cyclobacteriaceae bacterium]